MQDAPVHASPGGPAPNSRAQGSSESPNVSPHQAYPPQFHQPHTLNHAPLPHMLPYSQATYAYHPMSGVHHLPPPPVGSAASSHVPAPASSYNAAGPSHAQQQLQQLQHQQQQQHILPHPPALAAAQAEAGPSNTNASHLATAPSFGSAGGSTRRSSGGGKTFTCTGYQGCSMSFSRSEHLARHVRKHTGEKPFTCRCGKKFTRLDNLRQHASTIHADEPEANEELFTRLAAHMPRSGRAAAAAPRQKQTAAAAAAAASASSANNVPSPNNEASFSSPSSPTTPAAANQAPVHTATLEQQAQQQEPLQHPAGQSSSHSFARQLEPLTVHSSDASMPSSDHYQQQQHPHSLPRPLPSPSFRFPSGAAASASAATTTAPTIYHHPLASTRHHFDAAPDPIHHYAYPQESDFAAHQGPSPTLPSTQHFIPQHLNHAPEHHHHQQHQYQHQYFNAHNIQHSYPYEQTHPSQAHHGGRGGSSFRVTQHHPHPHPHPHPYPQQGQQQHSYTPTSGIEYPSSGTSSPSGIAVGHQHEAAAASSSSIKQQYSPVNVGVNGISAASSSSFGAARSTASSFTSKPTLPSLSSLIAGEPLPASVQAVDARYLHDPNRAEEEHRVHSSLLAAADLAMHRHSAPTLPLRMSMNRSPLLHINPPAYDSRSSSFSATSSSSTSAGHHTAATTPPPSITSPCSSVQTA